MLGLQKYKADKVIRIIAPSDSLDNLKKTEIKSAEKFLMMAGYKIEYGKNALKNDQSIEARLEDLHQAYSDTKVSMILAATGGFSEVQLLPDINWSLVKKNKKYFIGFSDNTILCNSIYQKTSQVAVYGPNFGGFSDSPWRDEQASWFTKIASASKTFQLNEGERWYDKTYTEAGTNITEHKNVGWWNMGKKLIADGVIVGGHLGCLVQLASLGFMPSLKNKVLVIEVSGDYSPGVFLSQLATIMEFKDVKKLEGLVIGRMPLSTGINRQALERVIGQIPQLTDMPILANVSFGHTSPKFSLPIGGRANINCHKQDPTFKLSEFK